MRKMKKILLLLAVASLAAVFASCGSSKTVVDNKNNSGVNPFGEVFEVPCTVRCNRYFKRFHEPKR